MFDLDRQIRLKQAKTALREGRLDEAFSIAIEKDIRELRGGQVLLENLVEPLLNRSDEHFHDGRLKEALVDAERAIAAGGQEAKAIALRDRIQGALSERRKKAQDAEALLASARRHVTEGHLRTGRERLEEATVELAPAQELRREIDNRERRVARSLERATAHLASGELLQAMDAVKDGLGAAGCRDAFQAFLSQISEQVTNRLDETLRGGDLSLARELTRRFRDCIGESLESLRFEEAVELAEKAAAAFQRADHEEVRVLLGRAQNLVPDAQWIQKGLQDLEKLSDALRSLRSGPLGALASAAGMAPTPEAKQHPKPSTALTLSAQPGKSFAGQRQPPVPSRADRHVLWIDGVGTYVLLAADRVSLGRAGSSARPDVAFPCDLAGHHVEIVRTEGDYFIVTGQGTVKVNGQVSERKLLESNDTIDLSARCRFRFRLPTALSTTAVLTLRGGQRLDGGANEVLLVDEHFLLGAKDNCHVRVSGCDEPVVLRLKNGQFFCRAKETLSVDGKLMGTETTVPPGSSVQVGELTFTITACAEGGV
jgi:hypothetical protein